MAQTNYTPISLYYSTTASAVPLAANLVQGELAINTNDGKLYYEDSSGVVQVLATKSTGSIGGSNTQVQFNNSGSLGGSSSFTWDGTTVTATKFAGALNGTVGATTASTGAFTTLSTSSTTTFSGLTASTALALDASKNVVSVTNTGTGNNVLSASPTLTGTIAGASLSLSSLTSGRVTYAGTAGLLQDSSNLTFDGNGNLSVTGTGNSVFTLTGSAGVSKFSFVSAAGTQFISTGVGGSNNMIFAINNTETMRLTSTALGIGTSSPSQKLNIATTSGNCYARVERASQSTGQVGYQWGGGTSSTDWLLYMPTSSDDLSFFGNSAERMRIDSSGKVLIGNSTAISTSPRLQVFRSDATVGATSYQLAWFSNATGYGNGIGIYAQDNVCGISADFSGASGGASALAFYTNATTTPLSPSERMRIDSSGNLLVGATSLIGTERLSVVATGNNPSAIFKNAAGSADYTSVNWNNATTGDNKFVGFYTETSPTLRGDITYNRVAGLVAYNTTSDYRAKDIISPVLDSGEVIDSVPVYIGKMKGATQARPMFIAHETPSYAHTGEKDAVDKDGNPVYQQMDASALVPVMWAEIQSLRQRIATLENK